MEPPGFTVSENGVLAYRTGGSGGGRQLAWIDRTGKVEGNIGKPALYENPRLSPDDKRLAVFKPDGGGDIWITDMERDTSTRFTFDPGADNDPVWSPDGTRIAFVSNRDGGVEDSPFKRGRPSSCKAMRGTVVWERRVSICSSGSRDTR